MSIDDVVNTVKSGESTSMCRSLNFHLVLQTIDIMRVAINVRFAGYKNSEGYDRYIRGIAAPMVSDFPLDKYIFLADTTLKTPFLDASNVSFKGSGPQARHPLLWKYWYDVVLPRMAKKANAECLFSPDGFCSLNTSIPQVLTIHDLAFLHFPQGISRLYLEYYKYYTPQFIKKAKHIITVSEFSRDDIVQHYPFAKNKISVIYNAADEQFSPLSYHEKELCRQRFTGGVEYFLYSGSIHPRKNLVSLLKGFSWFKKRQQSNMKLVLAGRMAWKNEAFTELLKTYKYREDVILTGHIPDEEFRQVMGSAYALVYPSWWEGFGLPVLEAMQSGVPVIASNNSAIPEIAQGAAYYNDPANDEGWGRAMGLIYKDETYREKLIGNGLERAAFFSWKNSAAALHQVIANTVS